MGAPFDNYAMDVFAITAKVMGYDATWNPVAGGSHNARVHFKSPASEEELAGHAYDQRMYICEWKRTDFAGLEISYKNSNERVVINGRTFAVIHVRALFDGQTYQAVLQLV